MSELIPKYKKELEELKTKMLAAQEFAKKFPCFEKEIIEKKLTDKWSGKISDRYGKLYLAWGINRYFYKDKINITNYSEEIEPQFLWNIYINRFSIFGDYYNECSLPEPEEGTEVFFFDGLNTTFYATDDEIMPLLEKLNEWYEKSLPIYQSGLNEVKRKKLLKQLEEMDRTTDANGDE